MKKYNSFFKFLLVIFAAFTITSCVHDDKYDDPNLEAYECVSPTYFADNGYTKWTLNDIKLKTQNQTFTDKAYIEGYVSSTDETGNIYKTIYIQDSPTNPTHGFTISVDAVSTYTKYPQGTKVYINVQGLALGTYGGLKQLGYMNGGTFGRIPEKLVGTYIKRSCSEKQEIVPVTMTLAQMSTKDNLLGALIKVEDAEFDAKVLCSVYAPEGVSVDRQINDPTMSASTRVVRNSGYASFANQLLPAGKGEFVGIFSKFNSTYQMYINRASELKMTNFPRKDGITTNPCTIDSSTYQVKTVSEVKQMLSGAMTQINGNFLLKAKVTANDETGNLYKYVYVEDATGGIRVNINKLNLYQDPRFKVGKDLYIKLNQLYVGNVNGEIQLGVPFNNNIGQIAEVDVYKYFFDTNSPIVAPVPTEKSISQLTTADVGRWIKIKDLEFIDADLGKPYANTGQTTNRTLKDCSGNTILLRTSNFATFATQEIDGGKGDVYAILSYFNGIYQLWIPKQVHADLDNTRCDGSLPPKVIFSDSFSGVLTDNWTAMSVTGAQSWNIQNFGNPAPCVVMNGFATVNNENEDWLISKPISLAGLTSAYLTFESDVRYAGNAIQVFVTSNYSGNPSNTTWTQLNPTLDTNSGAFNTWTNSGNLNLNSLVGQNVVIAFKYTSTTSAAATWEIDNVKIKGN